MKAHSHTPTHTLTQSFEKSKSKSESMRARTHSVIRSKIKIKIKIRIKIKSIRQNGPLSLFRFDLETDYCSRRDNEADRSVFSSFRLLTSTLRSTATEDGSAATPRQLQSRTTR